MHIIDNDVNVGSENNMVKFCNMNTLIILNIIVMTSNIANVIKSLDDTSNLVEMTNIKNMHR